MKPEEIDAEFVSYRLAEAGRTFLAVPARLRPEIDGAPSPRVPIAVPGAVFPLPDGAQIERMRESLSWLAFIPRDAGILRQLLLLRSLANPQTGRALFSWRMIGRHLGVDYHAIQKWHAAGVAAIVAVLKVRRAAA